MSYKNQPWAEGLAVKLYDSKEPTRGAKCLCGGCGVAFVGMREDVICPTCAEKLAQPAGPPPPREIVCEKCRVLCTELDDTGLCPVCRDVVAPPAVPNAVCGSCAKDFFCPEPVRRASIDCPECEAAGSGAPGGGKCGPMLASMPENAVLLRKPSPGEDGEFGLSPPETDLTAQVCALRQEIDEAKAALNIPSTVRLIDGVGRLRDKLRSAKRRATTGAARAY